MEAYPRSERLNDQSLKLKPAMLFFVKWQLHKVNNSCVFLETRDLEHFLSFDLKKSPPLMMKKSSSTL